MRKILASVLSVTLLSAGCGDEPAALVADDLALIVIERRQLVWLCYAEVPEPVVVEVRDNSGAPVIGQTVDFRVVQGGGWVRDGTAISDSGGRAADYWTLGAPGRQSLEARATGAGGSTEVVAGFLAFARQDVGSAIAEYPTDQYAPAISGDRIVWQDWRHGDGDIFLYGRTGTVRRITIDANRQDQPAISGDRIVWLDWRSGHGDIYLYDLATDTERRITTDPSDQEWPAISGDRIVWQDRRNGNGDIYLYDLASETERRITTDRSAQYDLAIAGDRIVWLDDRNGLDGDIYLYDLATETERRITLTDLSGQHDLAISGDRIVWADHRNGNSGVYLYDLNDPVVTDCSPPAR